MNPRPLSPIVPSNGLIGCVSADGKELLATAWEPYQELFQGVIVCLHSDFRIGGLKPGESKTIRGKIYLMPADFAALETRYRKDFPEHVSRALPPRPARRRRSSSNSAGTSPGRASCGATAPSSRPRPSTAASSTPRPGRRRGRPSTSPGSAGANDASPTRSSSTAREDLESIGQTRFRHNFLRFNTTPADLDWFDDHAAVMNNARLAAQLARAGPAGGSCSTPSNTRESCSIIRTSAIEAAHLG